MNMKSNLYYNAKYTVTGAMVDKVDQSDYRKIAKHFKKVGWWPISSS